MKSARTVARGVLPGALLAVLAGLPAGLSGCSVTTVGAAHATVGRSGFQAALARIAATPGTRSLIHYDDTSALVKLAGTSWSAGGTFAGLRGTGAGPLAQVGRLLASDPGISLLGARYAITAGQPPQEAGLLSGGQPGRRISTGLARLGWSRSGDRLIAPSPDHVGGNQQYTSVYAVDLAQVRIAGSDLRFGGAQANLGEIDAFPARTLAADPRTRALAGCLGNVVAAEIDAGYQGGRGTGAASPSPSPSPSRTAAPSRGTGPVAVAAGVRRPGANSSTPDAVVCVAWPNQAAADRYTSEVGGVLTGSVAPDLGVRYSRLLTHPAVRDIGGSQHLVAWQAGTPGNAGLAIEMAEDTTLPALPDCAHLPPQAVPKVTGCR